MTTIVKIGCDRDLGEGTCATRAWGRVGEDVAATTERARRAGWSRIRLTDGRERHECPWHAHGQYGGDSLL